MKNRLLVWYFMIILRFLQFSLTDIIWSGKVYKGKLSNSQDVAVKHIINDGFVETFLREVRSLAHVRHPNLVALLGYCENGDDCFLIYELCTNGNLSEWLFGIIILSLHKFFRSHFIFCFIIGKVD